MAAVDYFFKIDTIPGESTDSKHKDEIRPRELELGADQQPVPMRRRAAGGRRQGPACRTSPSRSEMDKPAPSCSWLAPPASTSKRGLLTCRKAGKEQQEYLKITFSKVFVSNYQTGGSGGDMVPTDQFSLNFTKLRISYAPQKDDNTLDSPVVHKYNLKTNKGS